MTPLYSVAILQPYVVIYYFFLQVLIPKMVYNGQKLTILVNKNTPPSTNNTMPTVLSTVLVIKSIANTIAKTIRIALSNDPIFAFIIFDFGE